jgi:conjugal transfer pilus assembly protein TraV
MTPLIQRICIAQYNVFAQRPRRLLPMVVLAVASALLSGCAGTLTGYKSETEHTCPSDTAKGLPCTPVSEVFRRSMAGQLPGQTGEAASEASNGSNRSPRSYAAQGASGAANLATAAMRPPMTSGMPVRTAPRVLRVWFAPWRDDLDVLHDQRHSYLTLDTGRWLIEHNQQRVIQQFAPTRLLQGAAGEAADAPAPQSGNRPSAQVPATPAQRAANPSAASLPFPGLPAAPSAAGGR